MPWNHLADELGWDDVGGRLLANLAHGIYSHEAVLREYVANAVDAYKALDPSGDDQSIVISPEGNDLCIQDSGIGMDEKDIREAKKIAVSTKAELEEMVGFRGIGIWAGFQACERLIIDSTKHGDTRRYRLTIEFADMLKHVEDNINIKELIDPRYRLEYTDADRDEHYTRVTLKTIHDDYKKLLDEKELVRIVSQVLPSRIDPDFQYYQELKEIFERWPLYHEFPIKIRTTSGLKEVFRTFPGQQQLEPPQEKIIESDEGIELGRAWYCRTKTTSLKETFPAIRGFRMRVRNFAVGPINIYDDEQGYTYGIQNNLILRTTQRLYWYCGEFHITNVSIRPNTPRDDLVRGPMVRLFIEKVRGFYRERINEAGAYSDFNPFRDALEDGEKLVEQHKNSSLPLSKDLVAEIQKLIEKLDKVSQQSKGSSKDQGTNLLKNLLRQKWFNDRVKKLTPALKKLVPKGVATQEAGSATVTQVATVKDSGKEVANTTANWPKGKSSVADKQSNVTSQGSILVEEVFSEILGILERRLGPDHDELEAIASEVEAVLYKWYGSNAAQSVP